MKHSDIQLDFARWLRASHGLRQPVYSSGNKRFLAWEGRWGIGGGHSVKFLGGIHYQEKNLSKFSEFFHLGVD